MSTPTTLADLAVRHPAATRVLWRHGLDFCCGGRTPFQEACRAAGLDPATVTAEIEREGATREGAERWDERPLPELIDHILRTFHEPLRRTLPVLVAMAEKVERVHAGKASCPRGLHALLADAEAAVADHLAKEEQVLFPMILAGRGPSAAMPVRVMLQEHDDHGANLRRIRALTGDLVLPAEACGTWRALYDGLSELERDLMEHIHLENNVLFPRALAR